MWRSRFEEGLLCHVLTLCSLDHNEIGGAMRNGFLAIFIIMHLMPAARADVLRVAGAGNLTSTFTDLLRRFPAGPDTTAAPEFGPSGLMREKIEAGADVDLFASADMAQARRLAVGHPERFVVNFTRNRLCAIARGALGLTSANMLDRLLDPTVRLATSTPGADPGGDYAWAVFARAEIEHPGARAVLEAKAQQLYGGAKTPPLVPGRGAVEGVFLADRADVALGYCSGAAGVAHEVPGLVVVPLPAELAVGPAYGLVVLDAKPVAYRFAMFVMSEAGQAILKEHGFDPVALVEPAPPSPGLLIQVAGAPTRLVSPERIARLPHLTQRVGFMTGHGEQQNEWSGPLLWDVLVESGAVDPAKPADQVHLAVRVTGADGYVAIIALAEIAPQFAGRPIQIADGMNGTSLPHQALRLIVPGDRRGGRSVRDVVRIDID
jgi:ABC-type molybdate transport system substrate-binding protein